MQYKKHPIDRALEALVPILAPSFTLRSFRDAERLPKKYPLIDYAIVGSASKEYDKTKNLWRTSYFVVLEMLVQERKPLDWCQFSELADAQDRNALFLSLEVIVEQLLVLLTNPKAVTPLIRPLDMIYSDLDFKLEGNPTGQYLHEHGTDKLTGVAVNFTISCLDSEGGACCLIDFNNADQVQALQALTEPGSVTWNLLANQGGNPPITPCDKIKLQLTDVLLLNCLLPLYDFSQTATQNALSPTQIADLQAAFCTPCPQPTRKSTILDGLNESIFAPYNVAHELERTDSFTIDIFVKISAYKLGAIIGKFDYQGIRRGYVLWTLADGRLVFELASNESTGNTVTTITINPVGLGAWKRLTVTYTGTSTAAGVTMYIDKSSVPYSVFQTNLTGTTVDSSNVIRIGGNDPGAFAGKVYAAKIWKNRALTPSEVAALPIETDTPIYQNDLICWQDCGTGATFGSTVAVYPDRTGITTGYQSVNTEASDFDTDVPT